jgi:zinc protease
VSRSATREPGHAIARTRAGSRVVVEPSDALPLVGIGFTLRTGSLSDPPGKEGLTRFTARSLRMGTSDLSARKLEEAIDGLGAQLSISTGYNYVHLGGTVVAHNAEAFFQLLSRILRRPAFRRADVEQVRRETLGDLASLCDDDRALVRRHFRRHAFDGHPYARPTSGTRASIGRIRRADLVRHHARHVTAPNLVIALWGAVDAGHALRWCDRHLGGLPRRPAPSPRVVEPRLAPGRRVLLVDKPERTQTQILIGTLGTRARDPEHVPLVVANTAFGGLFTSRLTNEVRAKRGWSYGASSGVSLNVTRDLWSMWTFPAAKDARACIELQLGLYERWVREGLSVRELAAARRHLVKSHAFDVDTAAKRLERHVDEIVFGLPRGYHDRFVPEVRKVSRAAVARALRRRLSTQNLVIAVVGTAKTLLPDLRALPGVKHVEVVRFDDV